MSTVRRRVFLTTGYEVDVADQDGLSHLFNAVSGESLQRIEKATQGEEKSAEQLFGGVYDLAILELYFVAGQLLQMGSGLTLQMLLDEFSVHWDHLAEIINKRLREPE